MESAKSPKVRLKHILENTDAILSAVANRNDVEIADDYLVQRAIERAIEIISEAAKALPAELRSQEPDVPWREIIGIGNLLRMSIAASIKLA